MEKKCYSTCPNQMEPGGRQGRRNWLKASHENKDAISEMGEDVDVVFYGDSITEGWKGTSISIPNGRKKNNLKVFNSLFTIEGGGKYKGIPMGISGDRVSGHCLMIFADVKLY